METIIIKPKNEAEAKEVFDFLKKLNVEAEVYPVPTKEEFLDSLERGATDVARHIRGEIELKDARQLLYEL